MKSQERGDSGFSKAAWPAAPTSLLRKAARGEVLREYFPFLARWERLSADCPVLFSRTPDILPLTCQEPGLDSRL